MPTFVSLKDQGFFEPGEQLLNAAQKFREMKIRQQMLPLEQALMKAQARSGNAGAAATEAGTPFIAPKAKADIKSTEEAARATGVGTDKTLAGKPYWASGARSEDETKFHAAQAAEIANKGATLQQGMQRSFLEDSGYKLPDISLRQYAPPPGTDGVQPLPGSPAKPSAPAVPQGAGPGAWQRLGAGVDDGMRAELTNALPQGHYKTVPSADGKSAEEWVYMPQTPTPARSAGQLPDVRRQMFPDGNGGFKAVFTGPQIQETRDGVVGFSEVDPQTGVRKFSPSAPMTTARDNRTHMKEVFRGLAELEDAIRRNGTWEAPYIGNQEDRGRLEALPPLVATQLTQLLTGLGATQGKVDYDLKHLLPLGPMSPRGETFSRLYQIKKSVLDSIREAQLSEPLPQGATEQSMIAEAQKRVAAGVPREKVEQFLNGYGLTLSTGVEEHSSFRK